MTKMDMIWVAAAGLIHPSMTPATTVTRRQIEAKVKALFGASITPVMVERHLVSSEDRLADKADPRRGGSRNRYLFRTSDGVTPSRTGGFRLYKNADRGHDGLEKTGPTHPAREAVDAKYCDLLDWYEARYAGASGDA